MAKIEGNFGSIHDGDIFIIAICDECITKKVESYTLLYRGNYMFQDDLVRDEIDKSKKGYRRRMNIDKVIE